MKKITSIILLLVMLLSMAILSACTPAHKCTPDEKWTYDENSHWHKCAELPYVELFGISYMDLLKASCAEDFDKADHTWDAGTITTPATQEADGIKNRVTEGAHTNVHCIKDGVLYTAPLDNLVLPGIARKNLIKVCNKLSIPVKEEAYSLEFLMNADEVMLSSSSNFCIVATHVDDIPVGGKAPELLKRLQDRLLDEFMTQTE